MAKDPAFLFYSQDFFTGSAVLSFEDKGKYIHILCLMHQQGRMDEETIRFTVGSISVKLKSKFNIDENGFWYNVRLEKEAAKRNKFTKSRVDNGSKGGRPKKNKTDRLSVGSANDNHMGNENENVINKEVINNNLWFLKYYHSNYEVYKSTFNGQSTTEVKFKEWKRFIDFIYLKKYEELFECKFISPHDFAKLSDFTEDKWDEPLKKILATGIKPEHNLFFRIPEFITYSRKSNDTFKATLGSIGKTIEFDRP